ncbi:MAG: OsmC family protein [Myxococcales bacterium]|nr:OsmC family protein [Myxococcales bacterium]
MQSIDVVRQHLELDSGRGTTLAAVLEQPAYGTYCYALFAHCLSATADDESAADRISRALCRRGIAVLRLDYSDEAVTCNADDLVAAARHLEQRLAAAPRLLVGHSRGGAAALVAAARIDSVKAVATIGAPSDQADLTALPKLRRALLLLHAPRDQVVGVDHARILFERAKHPKSFVSLDDADHVLSRHDDAEYAATVLAAWASRFLDPSGDEARNKAADVPEGQVRVQEQPGQREQGYRNTLLARTHVSSADEPLAAGGHDSGMTPYELLLAGLGACTSMTMRMYARRKGWPLDGVTVDLRHHRVHAADCDDCSSSEGKVDVIEKRIVIEGPELSDEQRERIYGIAARCPVHRTLENEIKIRSALAAAPVK